MAQKYFAKTRKILQRSFGLRFYERLSSFCHRKLRENYLSPARKIIFLFLLMLCAEITISLGAPVLRSVRINVPYVTTLNITEHSQKLFFLEKNCAHKTGPSFVVASQYSSLMPQAHEYSSVIPTFVKRAIFTIFVSLMKLLMRDDRIIVDTEIKLSPIKAQGPPFTEHLFSASYLLSGPSRHLYCCAISIIVKKETYHFYNGILVPSASINLHFINLIPKNPKNQKTEEDLIFPFFRFLKKEVRRLFSIVGGNAYRNGSVKIMSGGGVRIV